MSRSKKKEQKRREEYNKAVKHKMESAADLADKYAHSYKRSADKKLSAHKRNARIVNRKLFFIIGGIILQTIIFIFIIMLALLPARNSFSKMLNDYFGSEKPMFSVVELSESFIGSKNENEGVYYTEVDKPELNSFYATINSDEISEKIYYGMSDQALLSGVAQLSSTSLPGFGKPIMLYGYSGASFAGLENTSEEDVFTITTNYGVYKYKVSKTAVFSSTEKTPYSLEGEKEQLILCTDYPFSSYKRQTDKTYCVVADLVSGPEILY